MNNISLFYLLSDQAVGWVLMMFTFFVPLFVHRIRNDWPLLVVFFLFLLIFDIAGIYHVFVSPLKGGGSDALYFHEMATDWAKDGEWELATNAMFFKQYLGGMYRIFGESLLLGGALSILAVVFSTIVLLELVKILGLWEYRVGIVLLFVIPPGMVVRGVVTLREAYEVLFFISAVFFAISYHLTHKKIKLLWFFLFVILLAFIHKAFIIFAVVLALFFSFFFKLGHSNIFEINVKRTIGKFLIITAIGGVGMFIFSSENQIRGLEVAFAVVNQDTEYAEHIVQAKTSREADATYGTKMDFSSPLNFLAKLPITLMYYLFAPFPWKVSRAIDLYGFIESSARMMLVIGSFISLLLSKGDKRKIMNMLLLLYFMLAMLWAMGTTNYGTSMRHNITHNWIVILLGWPVISQFLSFNPKLAFRNSNANK